MTYTNGIAPIVTVSGPGNLHHLSYANIRPGIPNVVGIMPTTSEGTTNFLLGFSYTWAQYAFYWDGAGEAFWRLGFNSTVREPVGTSWTDATGLPWGDEIILGVDVSGELAGATENDEQVTVFFIHGDLD